VISLENREVGRKKDFCYRAILNNDSDRIANGVVVDTWFKRCAGITARFTHNFRDEVVYLFERDLRDRDSAIYRVVGEILRQGVTSLVWGTF
jgi:hypothetical protein